MKRKTGVSADAPDASPRENDESDPLIGRITLEADSDGTSLSEVSEDMEISDNDTSQTFDSEVDIESRAPGELGQLASHARAAGRELQRTFESDEESEEEDERGALGWGSRPSFYQASEPQKQDGVNQEDLEETLKMQKAELEQLHDSDFELPSTELSTEQPAVETDQGVTTSTEDATELSVLYDDLKLSLDEVRFKLGPLLEESRKGELCTEQGLSYLEAKHLLLLHYCMCIVFYFQLKLEGKSVKDHPVMLRLVEIRTYLEKLRPVEARLQPQVAKLLRAAAMAKDSDEMDVEEDVERLAPRPEDLVPKIQEGAEEVYRPPKIHAVAMEDHVAQRRRRQKGRQKAAVEDAMVSDIVRDLTGAPEVLSSGVDPVQRVKSVLAQRRAAELTQQEEDGYGRSHLGEKVRKALAKRSGGEHFGGTSLDALAEEIHDTVEAIRDAEAERQFPVEAEKPALLSGDADLPFRQRKLPDLLPAPPSPDSAEDRAPSVERTKASAPVSRSRPPRPPKTTAGRRGISDEIQKNRGLTPHRTRERKNPRRRHRLRFEDKEKRRKGQTATVYSQAPDRYGGEAFGITKRVKKSVRFG